MAAGLRLRGSGQVEEGQRRLEGTTGDQCGERVRPTATRGGTCPSPQHSGRLKQDRKFKSSLDTLVTQGDPFSKIKGVRGGTQGWEAPGSIPSAREGMEGGGRGLAGGGAGRQGGDGWQAAHCRLKGCGTPNSGRPTAGHGMQLAQGPPPGPGTHAGAAGGPAAAGRGPGRRWSGCTHIAQPGGTRSPAMGACPWWHCKHWRRWHR